MTTIADLVVATETRVTLARSRARLLRFRAELLPEGEPEAAKLRADAEQSDSDALSWAAAAQCLREAIRVNAETEAMLTGWPVKPDRPTLRLVAGDDAA